MISTMRSSALAGQGAEVLCPAWPLTNGTISTPCAVIAPAVIGGRDRALRDRAMGADLVDDLALRGDQRRPAAAHAPSRSWLAVPPRSTCM